MSDAARYLALVTAITGLANQFQSEGDAARSQAEVIRRLAPDNASELDTRAHELDRVAARIRTLVYKSVADD